MRGGVSALRPNWLAQLGLLLILIVYAGLTWLNSINIPLSKAPDEYVHFRYIRFIVENGRLPLTEAEREATGYKADQPPLYYGLVALATQWIDTDGPPTLKTTWESPRRRLVDLVLPRAMLVRTEDETWPYAGIFLAWMVGRWISVLLGAITIVLSYRIALEIFPGQFGLALAAAATLAFTPCFTYISAVLSDEPMLGVVVGLYFWGLVRLIKGPTCWFDFALVGLLMGLAVITKYSAVVLPLEFVLVLIWVAWRQRHRWVQWQRGLVVAALATVVASGGWFIFQTWHFNRVEQYGWFAGIVRPLIAGDESLPGVGFLAGVLTGTASEADRIEGEAQGSLWTWLVSLFTKFWVIEIVGAPPLYPPLYPLLLMLAVCLLAAAGWGLIWWRNQGQHRLWLGLLLLHLFIFLPIPLLRFFLSGRINDTAQARYLVFSAAPALGLLLAWGVTAVVDQKYRAWGLISLVGLMLTLSMSTAYHFRTGFPAPLPVRTLSTLADQPARPLQIRFDDGFELLGYDQSLAADNSALAVTLYWRSLTYAHEDYIVRVSLLDDKGQLIAETAAHPVEGRYPVRAWDPGDILHDQIALPLAGVPGGVYKLQLQLVGWQQPLAAGGRDRVDLGQVVITAAPAAGPSRALVGEKSELTGFDLWQAGAVVMGQPRYRYRAAIPIALSYNPALAGVKTRLWLVGPDQKRRGPVTGVGKLHTFIVDYDWPSGPYQLEAELWQSNQLLDHAVSNSLLTVENRPISFEPPAMSQRLEANFGNEIMLLGYDLPTRRVQPGQGAPLVLYWQALRQMRESYTIFARLVDSSGKAWGGYDRLPQENYNTFLWVPHEVVPDGFAVPVDPATPNGVYHLSVGLYLEQGGQAISLPLWQEGQATKTTSVTLGPLKVGGPPAQVQGGSDVTPKISLSIELGEPPVILLRGYDLARSEEALHLTLYWESLAQTEVDWSVFVHIRNQAGETMAQQDGPAGGGQYPSSLWDKAEGVADEIIVPLPPDLPAVAYQVVVGLYNLADGTRLAVPNSANGEIMLTTLELPGS
jgi:4-amino-4-deoxy-L-arabinose transferase-like glycosyltransferase